MPDFELENSIDGVVAGIDEAGRGPWAGRLWPGLWLFWTGIWQKNF